MPRLITVSNRLPITVSKKGDELSLRPSVGGLATGLASLYKSRAAAWVGWPGIASGRLDDGEKKEITRRLARDSCYPVSLSRYEIENYYQGYSNKTIWPLFHYFPLYTVYEKAYWNAYRRVNEKFRDAVVALAEPGDEIWVHDYHLMLLPGLLREAVPTAAIGFFLHIPFPSSEIFRLLPWREEILEGLLGADVIGFHTHGYVHHFASSLRHISRYEYAEGRVDVGNRVVIVEAFPMGIDFEKWAGAAEKAEVQNEVEKARKQLRDRKVILAVDRLDYTKGIPQRLEAFELFLRQHPEHRERCSLVMVAVPSRTAVETYAELKRRVDELVGKINGEFGTVGWVPIWYLYRSLPFEKLAAFYDLADVALVTPVRDGMNLIAKEFLATKSDGRGVLVLSELAGASQELGEALLVNPHNKEQIAAALATALVMPEEEQRRRNEAIRVRLRRYDVTRWAEQFLAALARAKKAQAELAARRLPREARRKLRHDYRAAQRRLLLLDYDGTLVPFAPRPEYAQPDAELIRLLKALSRDERNDVVILSGRPRKTLEAWLGFLELALVAEHGAWIKERAKTWSPLKPLRDDWKTHIRPIIESCADGIPGSFVEEKDFSLTLHYRAADAELAALRAGEFKEDLFHETVNLGLEILEGNKVIEVRNADVNKGRAALRFLDRERWDFILAVGDDRTDEDVFEVLPAEAYSIKVKLEPSHAHFNVDSASEVRKLLRQLAR
ncbi:MAG TPA: bifunctional alpha,alpha-trehalose-phosphate synthase (UDP-forming)/trehalose-phosphatase [bacterium]|nr:bifunctional alpha,alpha-trehalose-phosphate synthase (UDP-forming)/trehalose-phosphatase [bacterium]